MEGVNRQHYCREAAGCFRDCPQPIGWGITISAPHMHARALEELSDKLRPGSRALDVGSGSGYLTAAMAQLVGATGKVVGIDHISPLVDWCVRLRAPERRLDYPAWRRLVPCSAPCPHHADRRPRLAPPRRSRENVRRDGQQQLLDSGQLELHVADGFLGYPQAAPYDCIHVGAAPETIPAALKEQLAPGAHPSSLRITLS